MSPTLYNYTFPVPVAIDWQRLGTESGHIANVLREAAETARNETRQK